MQNDSENMSGKLENSVDINLDDDDEGEAAAMEDSDLEDEADEVFKLYCNQNWWRNLHVFKIF